MSIELTEQQQQQIENQADHPPRVINPRTHDRYVLLKEEVFEKVRDLFDGGRLTEDERRVILQGVWKRAGWDDPAMDDYAALLGEKPT